MTPASRFTLHTRRYSLRDQQRYLDEQIVQLQAEVERLKELYDRNAQELTDIEADLK